MSRLVMHFRNPPENATLVAPPEALAYMDVRGISIAAPMTPLEAWQRVMARPLPGLGLAFRIRDAISSLFGVKKIGGFIGDTPTDPMVGDKMDFFLVEDICPERLVLTERDKHLDVMTCITTSGGVLAITSSVKTHNLFGRLYMLPVGIAHKVIVGAMLRRMV